MPRKKVAKQVEREEIGVVAVRVMDELKPVGAKLPKLTDKQRLFCAEYIVDLNATQAALRAGYCAKTVNKSGPANLVKIGIQAEITRLRANRSELTQVKANDVVLELAKIGFSNIETFAKIEDGTVKVTEFKELVRDELAAVESIGTTKGGKITIKLHSKLHALEQLGKHLGIYQKDNEQKMDITLVNIVARMCGNGTG